MKLTELANKRNYAAKALKEQYEMSFKVDTLSKPSAQTMLTKVRGLMTETKQSSTPQADPSYMKLVFMEQALRTHLYDLKNRPQSRVVVENEEVEKSQVVLAAQDLVDQVQKMLEDVGQMQVKELPALVAGIESEIGVNESQAYNDQVSQQLDMLSAALKEAATAFKSALNSVTGQAVDAAFDAGADMGAEVGMDAGLDADMDDTGPVLGDEEPDMGGDMSTEEPELPATGGVGRAKR